MKADALASVLANYSVLQTSLESFAEMVYARVNGIGAQLDKFDFLFGVMLGEWLLRLADNLQSNLTAQGFVSS